MAGEEASHRVDAVQTWPQTRAYRFLRSYSDAVNGALLERWLPRERVARILKTDLFDEAVGDGLYAVLRRRADTVVGVDISEISASAARMRYAELLAEHADVRRLPHPDETFDVVVSNSTLDHFSSAREIGASLAELHRVLVPRGVLIVTLDNPLNPFVAARNGLPYGLLRRLRLVQYPMGATCGPGRLRSLLGEAGFRVTDTSAIMHIPRLFVLAVANVLPERALRTLLAGEALSWLPTRYLTGQFVAARAVKD